MTSTSHQSNAARATEESSVAVASASEGSTADSVLVNQDVLKSLTDVAANYHMASVNHADKANQYAKRVFAEGVSSLLTELEGIPEADGEKFELSQDTQIHVGKALLAASLLRDGEARPDIESAVSFVRDMKSLSKDDLTKLSNAKHYHYRRENKISYASNQVDFVADGKVFTGTRTDEDTAPPAYYNHGMGKDEIFGEAAGLARMGVVTDGQRLKQLASALRTGDGQSSDDKHEFALRAALALADSRDVANANVADALQLATELSAHLEGLLDSLPEVGSGDLRLALSTKGTSNRTSAFAYSIDQPDPVLPIEFKLPYHEGDLNEDGSLRAVGRTPKFDNLTVGSTSYNGVSDWTVTREADDRFDRLVFKGYAAPTLENWSEDSHSRTLSGSYELPTMEEAQVAVGA